MKSIFFQFNQFNLFECLFIHYWIYLKSQSTAATATAGSIRFYDVKLETGSRWLHNLLNAFIKSALALAVGIKMQ